MLTRDVQTYLSERRAAGFRLKTAGIHIESFGTCQ